MSFANAEWKQLSVGTVISEFEVYWEYGLVIPEYVAFSYYGPGSTAKPVIVNVLNTNNGRVVNGRTFLPAGFAGRVSICAAYIPFPGKDFEVNEEYCYFSEIRVQGQDMHPPEKGSCDIPPSILSVDPFRGGLVVNWDNPSGYDFFTLEISINGQPSRFIDDIEGQSYQVQRVKEGESYTFKVKGFKEFWLPLFDDCSSEYSTPIEEKLPTGWGYEDPRLSEPSHLSAVAPDSDHMNLFIIDDNGMPRTSFWNGNPWSMWYVMMWYNRLGQPETKFSPDAPIESVVVNQKKIMVFAVDVTGLMRVSVLGPKANWHVLWENIYLEKVFPKQCHIGVTSRSSNHVDIFAIGDDGKLYLAWTKNATVSNVTWNGWENMDSPLFPPGAPVAALSRSADYMDVAAVGEDGIVKLRWWNGGWKNWEDLDGARFLPGTHLSFVARSSDHMDLFGIDENGQLQNNHWNGSWEGWQVLPSPPLTPGTSLSAVSRRLEHIEVFYMDQQKRLWSTWFYEGWKGNFQVPSKGYLPQFHPHVSAISRNRRQLDVFGINAEQSDSRVWVTWFEGGRGDWSEIFFPI